MAEFVEEALAPDWSAGGRVHNWRNYVHDEIKALWHSFTHEQKSALYRQADEQVSSEHWE